MNIREIKKDLKKFWKWIWNSDSWLSYLVFLVLVFIFIKFIFLPVLSLLTGTLLPLAIVESCSMYHEGNFITDYDEWWGYWDEQNKYSQFDISKEDFQDFSFKKGFNKGDILFILGTKPEKIEIGDIIIFQTQRSTPIIHRVVSITKQDQEYTFSTIGDHNNGQLNSEKTISEDQLIGRAVLRAVPYLGWGKLIFFEPGRSENEKGPCKENY